MKESEGSPEYSYFSFLSNKKACIRLHGFHITVVVLTFD